MVAGYMYEEKKPKEVVDERKDDKDKKKKDKEEKKDDKAKKDEIYLLQIVDVVVFDTFIVVRAGFVQWNIKHLTRLHLQFSLVATPVIAKRKTSPKTSRLIKSWLWLFSRGEKKKKVREEDEYGEDKDETKSEKSEKKKGMKTKMGLKWITWIKIIITF